METGSSFWMPPPASTFAGDVDDLYFFIYWLNVFFFLVIAGGTVLFAWKYRRRHPDQLASQQMTHNTLIEAAWTIIPTIIVIGIFAWSFKVYMTLQVAPANAPEYKVVGKQWAWEFTEPDGCQTYGELHVEADKPVKLLMRSEDVIHSFYVPDFRIKQDVIPGRYTGALVPGAEAQRGRPSGVLHRVLRDEPLGHARQDQGAHARGDAEARVVPGQGRRRLGRETLQGSLRRLPHDRRQPARRSEHEGPVRPRGEARRRRDGQGRRELHRRVDPRADGEGGTLDHKRIGVMYLAAS
jgi:hypothetical protein